MIFLPNWFKKLPLHLKPLEDKIKDLEALRVKLGFSDDIFVMGIANSRWAVIQAQKATLERLKKTMLQASERELWKGILISRFEVKLKTPTPFDPPPDEILHRIETAGEIVANINSFDELIDYILNMDKDNLDDAEPIQSEIDKLLLEY